VETGTGEDLGDLDLAQGGAEGLEAPDEVGDEVGELFTGSGRRTRASGPSSLRRAVQEVIVAGVTRKVRAV